MKFPREFYIPKHAIPYQAPDMADAVVWLYTDQDCKGRVKFGALGFHGQAQSPDFHYTFRTEQARQMHVDNFVACRVSRAQTMARRKADRPRPHPLKVGDIMHTCWGYEQTNVEHFQIIRVIGAHTVELREIMQKVTETGWCRGTCEPIKDAFVKGDRGKPIKRRASHEGVVRIDNVRHAFPGAGKREFTSYA